MAFIIFFVLLNFVVCVFTFCGCIVLNIYINYIYK